jgi:hypothetical protein
MFDLLFCTFFSILSIPCFAIVFCIVSTFEYSCLWPRFVQVYRPMPLGGNPITVSKYPIISHHKADSCLEFIALYLFRITSFHHLLRPGGFKIQQTSTPKIMQFKQNDRLTTPSVSIY